MITSTSNQRVKQIAQWQEKARARRQDGVFLAEGLKMYQEAPVDLVREVYLTQDLLEHLKNREQESLQGDSRYGNSMRVDSMHMDSMYVDSTYVNSTYMDSTHMDSTHVDGIQTDSKNNINIEEKLEKTGYELVTQEVFARMSDTRTPQGILTVLQRPAYELGQMLRGERPLLVLLEDLQDPGNLGTILRTGEGAGITGVIMSKKTVDIYNPKTIRATMGSIYRVPFLYVEDLGETVGMLRERGIRVYAAHLQGQAYYSSFSFAGGTAFLIGNEGSGLRRETAEQADAYLKIPMEGQVESLNAAIAASLLVYEAHRQRNAETVYMDHQKYAPRGNMRD